MWEKTASAFSSVVLWKSEKPDTPIDTRIIKSVGKYATQLTGSSFHTGLHTADNTTKSAAASRDTVAEGYSVIATASTVTGPTQLTCGSIAQLPAM